MQYHLRQSLTAIDAFMLIRPEVVITFAPQKFDEAGNLKDETALGLIKQQLANFRAGRGARGVGSDPSLP
jgi:chromate reductase